MTTRLFLVRHGESVWNAEGRLQGQADPPLSDLGNRQAAALAEAFRARAIDVIYCSPLARARVTADTISMPHGRQPRIESALREIHLGAWQGRPSASVGIQPGDLSGDRAIQGVSGWPPDGEPLQAALQRVAPSLDAIIARHPGATVVLVAHSIVGRVALCHLLGAGLELVPRLKLKLASITMLRIDQSGAVLERLGDTGHLRNLDTSKGWAYGFALAESRQ